VDRNGEAKTKEQRTGVIQIDRLWLWVDRLDFLLSHRAFSFRGQSQSGCREGQPEERHDRDLEDLRELQDKPDELGLFDPDIQDDDVVVKGWQATHITGMFSSSLRMLPKNKQSAPTFIPAYGV
jgi:hypothetical protein